MDAPPAVSLRMGGRPSINFLQKRWASFHHLISSVDWKILSQIKKAKNFSAGVNTSANASVSINACVSACASVSISACTGASASASANTFPKFIEDQRILPSNLFRVHGHLCAIFIWMLIGRHPFINYDEE